jgi:hypothetical protein
MIAKNFVRSSQNIGHKMFFNGSHLNLKFNVFIIQFRNGNVLITGYKRMRGEDDTRSNNFLDY